jgi:hypothetical protein
MPFATHANREIAFIHQHLVSGSGLAVSFVDNGCEIADILRDMVTWSPTTNELATTGVHAGSLNEEGSAVSHVPSEREHGSFSSTLIEEFLECDSHRPGGIDREKARCERRR